MRRFAIALTALTLLLSGCHSAMIQTTLHNGTGARLELVEVDYPSASFGTQALAAGADFNYRFKVLGSGPLKIVYTDAAGKEHTQAGPELTEGMEGKLLIDVGATSVQWKPELRTLK